MAEAAIGALSVRRCVPKGTVMGRYDGKRVVVTGGTSGIGLATAQLLLGDGARVLVTGSTDRSRDTAAAELGGRAIAVKSDAASLTDIDGLVARAKAEFDFVDLLFVNAGISRWEPFESTTEALYDEVLTVDAKGPYFTVQKFVPLMAKGSAIVLTTW